MTTTTPAIRLSSPSDVLSAVPHLLGYEVTQSLVLICLGGAGHAEDGSGRATLGMAARMDLPAPGEAAAAVDALLPAVARADPDAALVIAYADSLTDATVAVEVLSATLTEVGIKVLHRLAVVAGQWTSLDHPVRNSWTAVPSPGSSAALEFAVAPGSAPAASRSALVGRCAAGPRAAPVGRECDRLTVVPDNPAEVTYETTDEVTIQRGAAAWGRLLLGGSGPGAAPDATVALAAMSLHADGVVLRDALAEWLAPGMLPLDVLNSAAVAALREHLPLPWHAGTDPDADSGEAAEDGDPVRLKVQLVDRLIAVAGCLPDDYAVPVLALLAHVAWLQGNGAVARIAIDRALAADPNYSWAVLIGRAGCRGCVPLSVTPVDGRAAPTDRPPAPLAHRTGAVASPAVAAEPGRRRRLRGPPVTCLAAPAPVPARRAGHRAGSRPTTAAPRRRGGSRRVRTGERAPARSAAGESAWGAVPRLPVVRFPMPLSEPGVRLSSHRALHKGCCRAGCRS